MPCTQPSTASPSSSPNASSSEARPTPTICTGATRRGKPCTALALRGSNPPRCRFHQVAAPQEGPRADGDLTGLPRPVRSGPDGPVGGINGLVDDLARRLRELSDYIDAHAEELGHERYLRAVDLQGRLANRVARLLRDRQQLLGERHDELDRAVEEALVIVGQAWGVALAP